MSADPSIFEPDIEDEGWDGGDEKNEETEVNKSLVKSKVKVKKPQEEKAKAFLYAGDKPNTKGATFVASIDIVCPNGEWKSCVLENIDVILEELIDYGIDLGKIDDYKFWIVADSSKNVLAVLSNPLNPAMITKLRRYLQPVVSAKCRSALKRVEELEDEVAELEAQIEELESKLRSCKRSLKKCTSSLGKSGDLLSQFVQFAGDIVKSNVELKKHEYEVMKYRYLSQMQPQIQPPQQRIELDPKKFIETIKEAKELLSDLMPSKKGDNRKSGGSEENGKDEGW